MFTTRNPLSRPFLCCYIHYSFPGERGYSHSLDKLWFASLIRSCLDTEFFQHLSSLIALTHKFLSLKSPPICKIVFSSQSRCFENVKMMKMKVPPLETKYNTTINNMEDATVLQHVLVGHVPKVVTKLPNESQLPNFVQLCLVNLPADLKSYRLVCSWKKICYR